MLSPRKAVVVAAFVFICIFIYSTRHSRLPPQEDSLGTFRSRTGGSVLPTHIDGSANEASSGNQLSNSHGGSQQLMSKPKTLVERLQYQYPYDPSGKFPGYIWQTWKYTPADGDFAEGLRAQEASWSEKHPGFIHEVITDTTAAHLIRYLYASVPEVVEAYNSLPVPVLKADFFRYLVLLARGGIYSDIDTEALKPATEWLPASVPASEIGLIIGIEADPDRPDWHDWYSRRIQFCQWTIQAKVGHPVLRSIVAQITEETLRLKRNGSLKKSKLDVSIVEFTGPARWTDTIFSYFNDPRFFAIDPKSKNITWEEFTGMKRPKKVGDVIVLPITSFSPGVQQMGAGEIDDDMAYVKHDFEGSWKADWERIKPVMEVPAPGNII